MNKLLNLTNNNLKITAGFIIALAVFSAALKINETKAQATNVATMPTSGTCALLITLPIPYLSTSNLGFTGYNMLGQITFTSATAGTFNGTVVNPTFTTSNSPYIGANSSVNLNNIAVAVSTMTTSNGFVGGYKMTFTNTSSGNQSILFELNAVPANGGKTIMVQSSGVGTANSPGLGPGSGVCQL